MSNELTWEKWQWEAWKSDPAVRRLGPVSRCIWFEILGDMWLEQAAEWHGTAADLARAAGVSEPEAEQFFEDAERTKVCDVSRGSHGDVTLKSRRRHREISVRENNRLRKQRSRGRGGGHDDVTPASHPGHGESKSKEIRDPTSITGEKKTIPRSDRKGHAPDGATRSLWDVGESLLESRAMLGKLIREHGEDRMREAIHATLDKQPAEPKSWLLGYLNGDNGAAHQERGSPRSAAERVRAGAEQRSRDRRRGS